ncbi:MAG TPA: hypothetical protein PKE66_09320, partial [Pyrinomonadaceae bacterium]|nr:hypothetical protein [Pyrinomonadaceae bacterium]
RPLGMHSSYLDTTPPHLLPNRSHSYFLREGLRTEGRFDANTGITVSNSGLNAPVADMVKYLDFLVGSAPARGGVDAASADGVVGSAGGQLGGSGTTYDTILQRSSLEEMWQPALKAETDANGNAGFTTDIGLIFFIDQRNGRRLIGHGGDQNGFISYIEFNPASKTASLFVLNTDVAGSPGSELISGLRRSLREAL